MWCDSCEHVHNSVLLTDFATYFLIISIWVTSVQRGWNQEQLPTSCVIYCHSGSIVINPHLYSTYSLLNMSSTVTSSQCLLESFCVCFFFNCPPFFVREICTSCFSCQTLTFQDLHESRFESDILSIIKQLQVVQYVCSIVHFCWSTE